MGRLQAMRQRLWGAWMAVQVEFQGRYSVERLRQLNAYINNLSTARLLLICLATPLPCLVLCLLKEAPPLAPPEAGVYDNWVFFIRGWVVEGIINATLLVQMSEGAATLKLTSSQVAFIALFASAVSVAVMFAICSVTIFPLPFGVLVIAPPDVLVMAVCLARMYGPRFQDDPTVWSDLKKQLSVIHCQISLTFVYPVYIYGFVSLTGLNQVLFVAILPVIKLVAKNWISRALADSDDIKPQSVIFIVEVFNAIYVSNALQSASSWPITGMIMAVDLIQFWLSMLDVVEILNGVKELMAKVPRDHILAQESFLQLALHILAVDEHLNGAEAQQSIEEHASGDTPVERFTSFNDSCSNLKALDTKRDPALVEAKSNEGHKTRSKRRLFHGTRVVPTGSSKEKDPLNWVSRSNPAIDSVDLKTIFSEAERALFIKKTTHVLFITEYIVLVEYVEVVLPIIYSLYRVALFQMPNHVYYASLATLSGDELWSSVLNVLAYSSLEFVSLIISIMVLKRTLGFSSLHQLAFVLETHVGIVQVALIDVLVYVTQVSLVHLGADFSFTFAWLHSKL